MSKVKILGIGISGDACHAARERADLSIMDLAKATRHSTAAYSRLENGLIKSSQVEFAIALYNACQDEKPADFPGLGFFDLLYAEIEHVPTGHVFRCSMSSLASNDDDMVSLMAQWAAICIRQWLEKRPDWTKIEDEVEMLRCGFAPIEGTESWLKPGAIGSFYIQQKQAA